MRRGSGRAVARRGPRIATSFPAAIIAAGGRGDRAAAASGGDPKQFHPLSGRALIEWSIDALRSMGCAEVIVALPPSLLARASELLEDPDAVRVVAGGETRQDSIRNALREVSSDRVLVHDAARPIVDPEMVRALIEALDEWDGAIAAVPVDETLKRVNGVAIVETVDRSNLWHAQTPQAFRTGVLRNAHQRAVDEGVVATDDAALLERYGGRVRVVAGARTNIKVTYPEDVLLAEALKATRR